MLLQYVYTCVFNGSLDVSIRSRLSKGDAAVEVIAISNTESTLPSNDDDSRKALCSMYTADRTEFINAAWSICVMMEERGTIVSIESCLPIRSYGLSQLLAAHLHGWLSTFKRHALTSRQL